MTVDDTPGSPSGEEPGPLRDQLADQRQRLAELISRPGASADDLLVALGELDVAHEELTVADEEIVAQKEHIDRLLAAHRDERLWRERVSAMLPVAVLVTDPAGTILEANAAAGLLLQVRLVNLIRKPLTVFVAEADRPKLRGALAESVAGSGERRFGVGVLPRRGEPVAVGAVGVLEPPDGHGETRVRWVLIPGTGGADLARSGHDVQEDDLDTAAAFAALCRLPVQSEDPQRLLAGMVAVARTALPEADAVSVILGAPLKPENTAGDSVLAQAVDGAQLTTAEGPAVDAHRLGEAVLCDQLAHDPRWPSLAGQASALHVASILAVPISAGDDVLGVFQVYAEDERAFGRRCVRVAELVASAIASVLLDVREKESLRELSQQMKEALESRAVIDQAKGMVIARYGGTPDEAFRRLSAISQRNNVKLREVARILVEGAAGRSSPGAPRRSP